MIVNTGLLRYLVSTVFFLSTLDHLYCTLQRVPKIFWRLGFGIYFTFGGLSLFLVDAIGHIKYQNDTMYVLFNESDDSLFGVSSLGMHWAVSFLAICIELTSFSDSDHFDSFPAQSPRYERTIMEHIMQLLVYTNS